MRVIKKEQRNIMQQNKIKTADFFITNPGEHVKESINSIKISSFYKTNQLVAIVEEYK